MKLQISEVKLRLSAQELEHFKGWLDLDLNAISWERRYISEFNQLWDLIFVADVDLSVQFESLKGVDRIIHEGPLLAWFKWIREKFLCYVFIHKDLSIMDISNLFNLELSRIGTILRDFFVERFPHIEELLSERFQVGTVISPNLDLNFVKLCDEFELTVLENGSVEGEILTGLEVTLYDDWGKLIQQLEATNLKDFVKAGKFTKEVNLSRQLRFLQELVLLFILGGLLIFVIKVGNKWYEETLVEKISLFEPNFFWLDKNLSFEGNNQLITNKIELSMAEIENLEQVESDKVFVDDFSSNRYGVESDVVLTSADSLPKDFSSADKEQSNYEEIRKGGYRNSRYGRRKAYRVMMTSVDPIETRKDVIRLLEKYKVKQVSNVKPGTSIPGGMYFNLFVPRVVLKEFLSKVSAVETATILESKTRFGGPPGTNKVFIWIKSI